MREYYMIVIGIMGGSIGLHRGDLKPIKGIMIRETEIRNYFVSKKECIDISELEKHLMKQLKTIYKFKRPIHLRTEEILLSEDDTRIKELLSPDFQPKNQS